MKVLSPCESLPPVISSICFGSSLSSNNILSALRWQLVRLLNKSIVSSFMVYSRQSGRGSLNSPESGTVWHPQQQHHEAIWCPQQARQVGLTDVSQCLEVEPGAERWSGLPELPRPVTRRTVTRSHPPLPTLPPPTWCPLSSHLPVASSVFLGTFLPSAFNSHF